MHFDGVLQYFENCTQAKFKALLSLGNPGVLPGEKKRLCKGYSLSVECGIQAFHDDRQIVATDEAKDYLTTIHSMLSDWHLQLGGLNLLRRATRSILV